MIDDWLRPFINIYLHESIQKTKKKYKQAKKKKQAKTNFKKIKQTKLLIKINCSKY